MPAKFWQRAWKRYNWMRRLSGRICTPSTATLGVASWIASLRASRASLTQSPANGLAQTMSATYGLPLVESLARLAPHSCFSKTLEGQPDIFAEQLGPNWSEWVTGLRQDYSARQKLAQATSANGFSCWPTANAHDGRRPGVDLKSTQGGNLNRDASKWDTPKASHADKGGPNMRDSAGRPQLCNQASHWQTPKAGEEESGSGKNSRGEMKLKAQAKNWTTPQCHDVTMRGSGQKPTAKAGNACLARDAKHWLTPHGMTGIDQHGKPGAGGEFAKHVTNWPTPKGRDHKGESQRGGHGLMDALPNMVSHFSRQGQTIQHGEKSSNDGPDSPPQLNPAFVEWLQGWPPEWTDYGSQVTEFVQYKQRLHSSFWRLLYAHQSR